MPELPDAVAIVVAELAHHDGLAGVLPAAADGAYNVTGGSEGETGNVLPPWPCLRVVETGAGSDRRLIHDLAPELALELWDDPAPSGQLPVTELRRRLYVILQLLVGVVEAREWLPGEPVLSYVGSTTKGTYLPDPTDGQPRYLATVAVVVHPATA